MERSRLILYLQGFTRGYKQVVVLDEYYCKNVLIQGSCKMIFIDFVKRAKKSIRCMKRTVIVLSRHS